MGATENTQSMGEYCTLLEGHSVNKIKYLLYLTDFTKRWGINTNKINKYGVQT